MRSLPESAQHCACIFGIAASWKTLKILLEQAPSLARVTAGSFQTSARVERILRPGITARLDLAVESRGAGRIAAFERCSLFEHGLG